MKTVLSELHFLPCIAVFQQYKQADVIELERCETYQKGSYRNRCYIVGANGVQRLSLPLEKGKNNQLDIHKVGLSNLENWGRQHWQSIRSAYGNAPFFPYYSEELEAIFLKPEKSLWEFNLKLLYQVFSFLQWDKPITFSTTYLPEVDGATTDIRQKISPKTYPPHVDKQKQFLNYPQVFLERHGFVPNLSIIDLLFCQGPQANLYLSASSAS